LFKDESGAALVSWLHQFAGKTLAVVERYALRVRAFVDAWLQFETRKLGEKVKYEDGAENGESDTNRNAVKKALILAAAIILFALAFGAYQLWFWMLSLLGIEVPWWAS
jgi:hypothetical protein